MLLRVNAVRDDLGQGLEEFVGLLWLLTGDNLPWLDRQRGSGGEGDARDSLLEVLYLPVSIL